MTYPEQWSTDAAANTKSPPIGAPEMGLPHDKTSDCIRVLMAGVRETWDKVVALETGGIPSADLAENSKKLDGRTRQQIYDDHWPVGSERGWGSTNLAGLTPAGLTATWGVVGQDGLLVGAGSTYAPGSTTGAGTAATADPGGAVAAGVSGGTALTEAHLGSNLDATPVVEAPSGTSRRLARVVPEAGSTPPFSAAQAHSHTLPAISSHGHAITLPKRYATVWVRRTA